jgi:hypothetical protein
MLREEHRLTVFEDRVLRRIFGPRRGEVGESFITSTLRLAVKSRRRDGQGMTPMWEKNSACGLWVGNQKERDH